MKKLFVFAILTGIAVTSILAQSRELKTEKNGFQWYRTHSSDYKVSAVKF